ncbi:hypothetical protein ACP275_10G013200 [Erythranthe tilingii]
MKSFQIFTTVFLILVLLPNGINYTFATAQSEKQLLLQLKNSLTYDSSLSTKLATWHESTDHCQWIGVKCDNQSRVSVLDLSNESISGGINNNSTSNLFRLVHLQTLNLAQNTFNSIELPLGFGKLAELRYLNLSNSGFSGQIPLDLSNLTSYTKLRELYLDGVNISAKGYNWCNAVSSYIPNLRVLSLSNTYLTGPFDSSLRKLQFLSVIRLDGNTFSSNFAEFFADFSDLSVLTLSSCNLSGVVPKKLFQIKSLETIDLSGNRYLRGSLPEFDINGGSLRNLLLSYTNFSGNLPESLGNLKMLSNFDLRGCGFSGMIPGSIKNLSRLIYLDLSQNRFIGSVPSFALLENLTVINLHGNRLTGKISGSSSHWKGLKNLNFLDLSDNSIEGEIPSSLFVLPVLKVLYLSNNRFYGSLNISSSSSLEVLQLSMNNLEGSIPRFLFGLENLSSLSLASNRFNGFLELTDLHKLKNLVNLDLSYNNISVRVSEKVPISSLLPRLGSLMLASCKMNKLPLLKNQSSLMMLDLSDNELNGEIPNWIWEVGNGFLRFLNLSNNRFSLLQEPYSFGNCNLSIPCGFDIRLSRVHFYYLFAIRALACWYLAPNRNLDYLDLHSNMLRGQIPLPPPTAVFFSIANNRIFGNIPSSFCNARRIQMLDLSSNSLHGRIPSCLTENTFMRALNLSRNKLGGRIPDSIGKMQQLESLDLSFNGLGGEIPEQIVELRLLSFLNLSYNHLVGKIPQGGRIQTFPASSFVGNKGLCGFPLANQSCSDFGAPPFSHIKGRAGKFRY